MLLGLIYFKNSEYERAEAIFLEILNNEENKSKVYSALSSVYYYMNEKEKAVNFAKKAYESDSYNLTAKK
jgi:tetratricopeptide (TPR) repeat protein